MLVHGFLIIHAHIRLDIAICNEYFSRGRARTRESSWELIRKKERNSLLRSRWDIWSTGTPVLLSYGGSLTRVGS